MSDLQQDTYTLYTLVFVSVLQGNKREIAIVIVFTINILHRIQETKWVNMVVKQ